MEYLLDDSYPYFGGKIEIYEVVDEENEILGKGCYLSNNYVMLPFHAITEDVDEADIILEEPIADFAIIRVDCNVQSLVPIVTRKLVLDSAIVREPAVIDGYDYVMTATFSSDLVPGNSGSVIYGTGAAVNCFTRQEMNVSVPLYMVIARNRHDHQEGMLIFLPHLLKYGLRKDFPDVAPLKAITAEVMRDWELITKFGEIQRQVNEAAAAAFPTPQSISSRMNTLRLMTNGVDNDFITRLMVQKGSRATNLKNAFLVADLLRQQATPHEDSCWVVTRERDNSDGGSSFFKKVSSRMVKWGILNTESANMQKVVLYPDTGRKITVNESSYKYFLKVQNRKHSACHHPMLCELNDHNKGVHIKLTHCCFRPSHLVYLNKGFNDFCTCVLQKMAGPTGGGKIEVEW